MCSPFTFADGAKIRTGDSDGGHGRELSRRGPGGFHRLRGQIGTDRGSPSGMGADPSFVRLKCVLLEEIGGEAAWLRIFGYCQGGGGILEAKTGRGQTVAGENELRGSCQVREEHQGRTRKRRGVEVHVVNYLYYFTQFYTIYRF